MVGERRQQQPGREEARTEPMVSGPASQRGEPRPPVGAGTGRSRTRAPGRSGLASTRRPWPRYSRCHASRVPSAIASNRTTSADRAARRPAASTGRPGEVRRRDDAVVDASGGVGRDAGLEPLPEVHAGVPQELVVRRPSAPGRGGGAPAALPPRTRPSGPSIRNARPGFRESPYARHSSHGTSAAASPHPRTRPSRPGRRCRTGGHRPGSGVIVGTRPSGHWSAARSRSQRPREPGDVESARGGGDETCQSPVNPDRSPLRTVGRDVTRVAAQAPHRGPVQGLEPRVAARERPGHGQVRVDDHGGHVARRARRGARRAGRTGSRGWCVAARRRRGRTARNDRVDLPGGQRLPDLEVERPQVVGGDAAVRADLLAVGQGEPGAGRAEVGEPDPAVDLLPDPRRPCGGRGRLVHRRDLPIRRVAVPWWRPAGRGSRSAGRRAGAPGPSRRRQAVTRTRRGSSAADPPTGRPSDRPPRCGSAGDHQDPSVATSVSADPGSPATSESSSPVLVPQPSAPRWKPCRPRNQPSESRTAIVFAPGRRRE